MGRAKPSKPREIGQSVPISTRDPSTWGINEDQMKLQAFAGTVQARDHFDTSKEDNVVYVTLMRQPVFLSLAKCARPLIEMREAISGWALVEIYARSKGMAGAQDREVQSFIDRGFGPRDPITDNTIDNGRRFLHLCASIPHGDQRKALQALCVAITEASGPVEWRGVVERATGVKRAEVQAYIVRQALEALTEAFHSEIYGEWRR